MQELLLQAYQDNANGKKTLISFHNGLQSQTSRGEFLEELEFQ
jgi:hypothetical protein